MNRRSLGVVACVLIGLMGLVSVAGLDNLPRSLRDQAQAAPARLETRKSAWNSSRAFVEQALQQEPDLFRSQAADWRQRLDRERSRLDAAAGMLPSASQLLQANRREDAAKLRAALGQVDLAADDAVRDIAALRADAERWLQFKKDLPRRAEAFRSRYKSLEAAAVDALAAPSRKAMIDWPAKKADLEARIDGMRKLRDEADSLWKSAQPSLASVSSGDLKNFDYGAFFALADRMDAAAGQVKSAAETVNALSAQLYTNWDKMLLEVDDGTPPREKVRFVRTRFPDATLANGQVSSEEKWEPLEAARARDAERARGMVVEHKPAGKYDSEAERTVQPPAYAYMAPPGQSNAYGSWHNGVWNWLPQYLLMSHLLNASRGPMTMGDYNGYAAARQRGDVYYGSRDQFRPPARPLPGVSSSRGPDSPRPWWRERSRDSGSPAAASPAPKGFGDSRYRSRGSYSSSPYASRGGYSSGSRSYSRPSGRSFSRGGRR